LLECDGHRVEVAEDGPQGVEKTLALRPDVALVDIGLPGLDGYEVARRVRAAPGGTDILLIAVTGYGQPEDRRRTLEAGFDRHLVKPIDVDELQRLLADVKRSTA
jgi:CheY-like chemotaxis protein